MQKINLISRNSMRQEQFNKIADLRYYFPHHPDQEMVRTACLHYLGDEAQRWWKRYIKSKWYKDNPEYVLTKEEYIKKYKHSKSYRKKAWIHFFKTNSSSCVITGKKVYHIRLSKDKKHADPYTIDGEMMTLDHIIPKIKGGSNNIDNLQPMLEKLNSKKGALDDKTFKDANESI